LVGLFAGWLVFWLVGRNSLLDVFVIVCFFIINRLIDVLVGWSDSRVVGLLVGC